MAMVDELLTDMADGFKGFRKVYENYDVLIKNWNIK